MNIFSIFELIIIVLFTGLAINAFIQIILAFLPKWCNDDYKQNLISTLQQK